MQNIPFFDYQYFFNQYGKEITAIIHDVMQRGAFILQQDLADFEQQFAAYLGVKHAIGVANCTDGLLLALKAAGMGKGDEVIFPTHTFVASASAIRDAGAVPVPVECGTDHMLDPKAVENAITRRTRAIMPVQLNGRSCNMEAIGAIADKHNLVIIEDSAQGLGSSYKGIKAGVGGLAAAFSFYPAKILGCFGDGGMVVTNDDVIAEKLFCLHDHGRNREGELKMWGMNSRLDNMQAAVLSFFLARFDEVIAKRRYIAQLYQDSLSSIPDLILPPPPEDNGDHFDVYQNYEIESSYRDELQTYLQEHGVGTLRQWGGSAVHQFEALDFDVSLPFSEQMIARSLLIPMNMVLTDADVEYVCEQIHKFYRTKN